MKTKIYRSFADLKNAIELTAEEKAVLRFNNNMKDPGWKDWYEDQSDHVKLMAQKYPFEKYLIKAGCSLAVPGQIVHVLGYHDEENSDMVFVGIHAWEKTIDHLTYETKLYEQGAYEDSEKTLEDVHDTFVNLVISAKWLLPVIE